MLDFLTPGLACDLRLLQHTNANKIIKTIAAEATAGTNTVMVELEF